MKFADYIKEREDFETLIYHPGFITYKISNEECYIRDIYVVPKERKSHIASKMADEVAEIAKGKGCKYLIGSVSPFAKGSHESLLVLIAYGFRLLRSEFNMIYFIKEI